MNSRRNLGLPKFRSVNLSKGNSVQQTMIAPRVAEATSSKPSWSNQTTGRQGLWGSEVARKALSIWSGSVSQQPNLLPAAQDSLIRQAAFSCSRLRTQALCLPASSLGCSRYHSRAFLLHFFSPSYKISYYSYPKPIILTIWTPRCEGSLFCFSFSSLCT